tara:strand:+ start:826 stop:966 length:141 start_codon:yes stop_codon:yes gene_type:complete
MYDILMFLSLGGMFGVVGFLGARMIEDRKAKKTVKASHFYRKEGYQ